MEKTKLNKETSELLITIEADKKEWKKQLDRAFKEESDNLELKGFRKGHIPESVAKQNISQEKLFAHGVEHMLDIMIKEAAESVDKDLMVLDSPTYKVEKISDAELTVTFIYPIYPEFKLPDYKNLEAKYEPAKFDKKVVEEELKKIVDQRATLEKKDKSIENGDTAVFDFLGKVDGEAFEGGTAEKYTLEIGSGQFIPGFEDQMIGLKAGDEKDLNVTFPETYQAENLKGKDAVFTVKIHEVKANIEKVFKDQVEQQAREAYRQRAFEEIKKGVEINLPLQLVAKEMKTQEKNFEETMKQQGLTMQQYIEMTGVSPETLSSQFKKEAETRLIDSLIFAEIAKVEKIEIKDDEYDKEYEKLAVVYGQDVDSIKNVITKAQMQIPMTNDKVLDILIKNNK